MVLLPLKSLTKVVLSDLYTILKTSFFVAVIITFLIFTKELSYIQIVFVTKGQGCATVRLASCMILIILHFVLVTREVMDVRDFWGAYTNMVRFVVVKNKVDFYLRDSILNLKTVAEEANCTVE